MHLKGTFRRMKLYFFLNDPYIFQIKMCSDEALEEIEALTAILEETSFNNSNDDNISLVNLFYVHLDI